MQSVSLKLVAEAPDEAFRPLCRETQVICIEGDSTTTDVISGTGNEILDRRLTDLQAQMGTMPARFTNTLSDSAVLAGDTDRMTSVHVAYHHEPDGKFRMVVEQKMFYDLLSRWIFLFGLLSITAHGVWLIGGLFLIFWHRKKIRCRSGAAS